jgi:hypothetical protein
MEGASGDAHVYCSRLDNDVGVVVVVCDDDEAMKAMMLREDKMLFTLNIQHQEQEWIDTRDRNSHAPFFGANLNANCYTVLGRSLHSRYINGLQVVYAAVGVTCFVFICILSMGRFFFSFLHFSPCTTSKVLYASYAHSCAAS